MQTWEYKILYSWSKSTKKGELNLDWEWAIWEEVKGKTLKGFTKITEYLNKLGSDRWELIAVMLINWPCGETDAFQMFFKRPKRENERE